MSEPTPVDRLLAETMRTLRIPGVVAWLARHLPGRPPRSTVLGFWSCPWSGDDNDPIPRRYWLWYWLYRWTSTAKHLVGWHDWRRQGGTWAEDSPHAAPFRMHCHWCGRNKPMPGWVRALENPASR